MTYAMPPIPVTEHTMGAIRIADHRRISTRYPGLTVEVTGRTWRGEQDGHAHEAAGMGLLWREVADCATCLMRDWPGWEISGARGEGYVARCGGQEISCATVSQLVCRLATTGWTAW